MSDILEIRSLSHLYNGGNRGIHDISFSVKPGELILVAGRNGSGKSTLFRHLNGLMLPTSGDVLLHGRSVFSNLSFVRQRVGMIFQDADCQIVGQTVFEDAAFGPENLGLPISEVNERTSGALKQLELFHLKDQNPSTLSGGEKRKLAVAGVLTMNPELIVFDEPFSNLDYPGVKELISSILSLNRAGCTILISTHDIEKIVMYASRMIVIHQGRLVEDDEPVKLIKNIESYGIREPCSSKLGYGILPWTEVTG